MLLGTLLLAFALASPALSYLYTIDGTTLGPRLDGFGAISGGGATSRLLLSYPPDVLSDILDLLFLPSYGASLHHLKVEIGGDGQSSEGVEPSHLHTDDAAAANFHRGYEFQIAKMARARNPAILLSALPWTWPGWVGAGTRSPWTDTNKSVSYILSWLEGARDVHNLTFTYVNAAWNERGWSAAYVLALRAALDARGFGYIGLVCGDDAHAFSCAAQAAAQPALASAIVALGSHGPQGPNPPASGLPLWDTEAHVVDPGGTDLATLWSDLYLTQNVTAGTLWNLVSSYNPGLFSPDWGIFRAWAPWCGFYQPLGKLWAFAHYTQATAPGMHWLPRGAGAGALAGGGTYVSFLHPATGALTLVLSKPAANSSSESAAFALRLPRGAPAALQAVRSALTPGAAAPALGAYFVAQPPVPVAGDGTTAPLTISPGELWTLTSLPPGTLRKGSPARAPGAPAPFPAAYRDDFSACPLASEPAYFTDQTGSFECAAAAPGGSSGVALVQSVPAHPIAWRPEEQRPFSLFAADIGVAAVNVSVRFYLPGGGGTALLGARANPNDCCGRVITGEDLMPGAWLAVCSAGGGRWGLYNAIANVSAGCGGQAGAGGCLGAGAIAGGLAPGQWHALELRVSAAGAASAALPGGAGALFEGLPLGASVPAHGFVGLGTGDWGMYVQFQDFSYAAEAPGAGGGVI